MASTGTTPGAGGSGGAGGSAGRGGSAGGPLDAGHDGPHGEAGPPPPTPPFDWVGIVGTGQSLSVGADAAAVVSGTQPYGNLKLFDASPNPTYANLADLLSLVPLTAPIRPVFPGDPPIYYPNNIYGETPSEGMANQVTATALALGAAGYVTVHTVVGEAGESITSIQKNGTGKAYASTLFEAQAIADLAKKAGKTFGYRAILLTHGETDALDADYEAQVFNLWADYNVDLPAITGQKTPIPLILSQQNTFPGSPGKALSTVAQWQLGVDYPGEILCAGPKYQYPYAAIDHIHLMARDYRRLGEKYAEVYTRVTMQGEAWKPLQPSAATLAGNVITVTFDVPDPPLAWEPTAPNPHQAVNTQWANGRGFEVEDATGPLAIASVSLAGNAVAITLDAPPAGAGLTVGYGLTQDGNGFTGGTSGTRGGQLTDSDAFVGRDAETIACAVSPGSTTVIGAAAGALDGRGVGDRVTGAGLPDGTLVIGVPGENTLSLSQPWSAAAGSANLFFHADQRNYCVEFELPVL